MQSIHVIIYNDLTKTMKKDLHDHKSRELITLTYIIISGFKLSIALHIERSINSVTTRQNILSVLYYITVDSQFFCLIFEVLRALNLHFEKGGNMND